ncbi:MAG TPA: sulfotransferase [Phycisphaerae bacterium]|nr:sulfotransferase [Phycisphaerae bacterium]
MINSPLFFIVGYERSGTTLLAAMLDRHSRIAIPPETHFFEHVCRVEDARKCANTETLVDRFINAPRSRDLKLNKSELLNQLAGSESTWANLLAAALQLYMVKHGKERVGEKTPNHHLIVPEILNLFPGSRVIWVLRDGRDVILSLMKTPWPRHRLLRLHAFEWRRSMEKMIEFEKRFPERMIRMKFENLVTDPEAELRRVCEFIGVDFETRQLDSNVHTDVVPEWELSWKHRVFSPPDLTRIGTWKHECTREDQWMLNSVMQPCLSKLDYSVDHAMDDCPLSVQFKNNAANVFCRYRPSWYRSWSQRFFSKTSPGQNVWKIFCKTEYNSAMEKTENH